MASSVDKRAQDQRIKKVSALHYRTMMLEILVGFVCGCLFDGDMLVTIMVLVTSLSVLLVDTRVVSFSNITATYGIATKVDEQGDSKVNITIGYTPLFTSRVKEEPISTDRAIYLHGEQGLREGNMVLVEYDRKDRSTPIVVGGKRDIIFEVISTLSGFYMLGHFIRLIVLAVANRG